MPIGNSQRGVRGVVDGIPAIRHHDTPVAVEIREGRQLPGSLRLCREDYEIGSCQRAPFPPWVSHSGTDELERAVGPLIPIIEHERSPVVSSKIMSRDMK